MCEECCASEEVGRAMEGRAKRGKSCCFQFKMRLVSANRGGLRGE